MPVSEVRKEDLTRLKGPDGRIKGVERDTSVDEIKQSLRGSSSNKSCKTKSYKINSLLRSSHVNVNVNVNQLMEQRTVASLHPRTATTTQATKVSRTSSDRKMPIEPQSA